MAKSTPIFRQKKIDRTVAIDTTGASEYTQYRPFAYFEPKLKNRFVLYLDVQGIYIPSYLVKSATKPGFTYDNIELQYINTKTNFKGKMTWDPIEIVLYDPVAAHRFSPRASNNPFVDPLSSSEEVSNDSSVLIYEWILNTHSNYIEGREYALETYKKTLILETLMPRTNIQSERWEIHGAYVSSVKWGDLDLSDDSLSTCSVTIMYDYALIKDANERKVLPYNGDSIFNKIKPESIIPASLRGQGLA
tara:strand:+ start:19088 stop:19831 length:744 start_codon:yes stop_codon:yes gene_type:complete